MKVSSIAKRRLNPRAILILVLGGLALGVGVHFVHAFQVQRNARSLYEQALREEQEGHPARAVDFLNQYLGLVPRDTDAQAKYGSLLHQQARTPRAMIQAFLVLEKVLREDGERQDIRRQAAQAALAIGSIPDAIVHLEILLQSTPEDAELLELRADCEVGERRFDAAVEWYERAFGAAPGRVGLALKYASLLRNHLEQPEDGDAVIEQLVHADARALPARLAAARYYRQFDAWDKVDEHVRFARAELASEDADILLLAAEAALERGRVEDARMVLKLGFQLYPQDTRLSQALARLELRSGQRGQALEILEKSFQTLPQKPEELSGLAQTLLDVGELDKAQEVIRRLAEMSQAPLVGYLQARLLAKREAWGEARQLLEQVRATLLPTSDLQRGINFLLIECYERLGNPDQLYDAARRLSTSDPNSVSARRAVAASLVALGKLDEAILEYRKVVARAPEHRLELARLLVEQNLRRSVGDRHSREVEALLAELAADAALGLPVKLLQAQVLVAQQKPGEARRLIEAERDRDPKQVEPWRFLIGLTEMQQIPGDVLTLIEQAERAAGKHTAWQLARANHWVRAGGKDATQKVHSLEDSLKQFPLPDAGQLRAGLAEAYVRLGSGPDADRLWQQLAKDQPNNLAVRGRLLESALGRGDAKELDQVLREIRNLEGGSEALTLYGEAAQALLQARAGKKEMLATARARLAEAAKLRPSWSRVPLLEAEAYELENDKEKALERYKAAVERGEGRLGVVRRMVELMREQRLYSEANTLVARLPQEVVSQIGLGRMAAELSLLDPGVSTADRARAQREALEKAKKEVPPDSKDYRDHLWLGQIAVAALQPQEAEKAFRQACMLNGADAETWGNLLVFLARTDPKKAEAELAEARRQLPPAEAPLVLAAAREALGQVEQADEQYQAVLGVRPNDPLVVRAAAGFYARAGQHAKAEALLRRLLDPALNVPDAAKGWARRLLALTLTFQGGYARFQEADKLLADGGTSDSPEERLARAMVLASQPARRREALRLSESLAAQRGGASAELRYLLAQLYDADGNWRAAEAQLLQLLDANPRNPVYLRHYVSGLLREARANEAHSWVEKLALVAPKAPSTLPLRVRVLKAIGRAQEAATLIQAYVREENAELDRAAALLEQIGQPIEAETLLRKLVSTSKNPVAPLVLAQHLARQSRSSEALALCERAWETAPPAAVAAACLYIVRTGKVAQEEQRRVEGWLKAAIAKQPQARALPGLLAELFEFQGRQEEAIALYREILRMDGRNFVVLNNLAYSLSLMDAKNAESLPMIEKAIQIAGPIADLLDSRAVIHLRNDRVEQAISDLQQSLAQTPSGLSYFHLAQAQLQNQNRLAARQAYRKAADLGMTEAGMHVLEREEFRRVVNELR